MDDLLASIRMRPIGCGLVRWGPGGWARREKRSIVLSTASLERAFATCAPSGLERRRGAGPVLCAVPPVEGPEHGDDMVVARLHQAKDALDGTIMEAGQSGWTYVMPAFDGLAMVTTAVPWTREPHAAMDDQLARSTVARTCVGDAVGDVTLAAAMPAMGRLQDRNGAFHVGPAVIRLNPLCAGGADARIKSTILVAVAASQAALTGEATALAGHVEWRHLVFLDGHLAKLCTLYEDAGFATDAIRRSQCAVRTRMAGLTGIEPMSLHGLDLRQASG